MTSPADLDNTGITLLADQPASEDEFSGGGHARTANALTELLKRNQMSGKAIGLEGGWGSGKSTVIRLAKNSLNDQLDEEGAHIFFTFSLWRSHTRNDLRPSGPSFISRV